MAAADRDRRAAKRDRMAAARESGSGHVVSGRQLRAAAEDRRAAAADRHAAAADRRAAAADRELSDLDELTGALRRGPGLEVLGQLIAEARRGGDQLTVAFIDVDGLKRVNDDHGHAAGDRLLRDVAGALRDTVRAYDVVLRYGGDEFVCALPGLGAAEASRRMAAVSAALAERAQPESISVGWTELEAGDNATQIVARADAALYARRERRRFAR